MFHSNIRLTFSQVHTGCKLYYDYATPGARLQIAISRLLLTIGLGIGYLPVFTYPYILRFVCSDNISTYNDCEGNMIGIKERAHDIGDCHRRMSRSIFVHKTIFLRNCCREIRNII